MVVTPPHVIDEVICFQYSLCRVVLMVVPYLGLLMFDVVLSVLALSSRFDGRSVFNST